MNRRAARGLMAAGALTVVVGCGTTTGDDARPLDLTTTTPGPVEPRSSTLVQARDWPTGIPIDMTRLDIAYTEDAARALWDDAAAALPTFSHTDGRVEPGIYGTFGSIDLTTEVLVRYLHSGSGSCPDWVESIATSADSRVTVTTENGLAPHTPCTMDLVGYTSVAVVPREAVPPADRLPDSRLEVPGDHKINGGVHEYTAD